MRALLDLFGVPWLIAPMEAEAQCCALEQLGLCDGVVSNDSDVFVFGAQRVYRNIFDERKYVEAYLAADVRHELGISRALLLGLALLLGSDYTSGVKGIGIVNASEVLSAFAHHSAAHGLLVVGGGDHVTPGEQAAMAEVPAGGAALAMGGAPPHPAAAQTLAAVGANSLDGDKAAAAICLRTLRRFRKWLDSGLEANIQTAVSQMVQKGRRKHAPAATCCPCKTARARCLELSACACR